MQVEVVQEYSFSDLQQQLEKHGYVLGRTQLYQYLKQSQVTRLSPGFYDSSSFERVLYFAQMMLRYRHTATAKTKFHQRYPLQETSKNDDKQQRVPEDPGSRSPNTGEWFSRAGNQPGTQSGSAFGF